MRYPLAEWGVTESEALEYCYERGYTWGGLYEGRKRVSCWNCPLQSLQQLRALRNDHPQLWQELIEQQGRSCNTFRINCSVNDLDRRFREESKQLSFFV